MKHKLFTSVYAHAIIVLFLSILCSSAAATDWVSSSIGENIAGTYLLKENDDGGSRIVTITKNGNWFGIHSYQLKNNFSNQQGVWTKTGKRQISVKTLNFSSIEDDVGTSLFCFILEFDKTYHHVKGTLSGKLFPSEVDPLDPVAVPFRTFNNKFTGKRLTVTGK